MVEKTEDEGSGAARVTITVPRELARALAEARARAKRVGRDLNVSAICQRALEKFIRREEKS